MRTITIKKTDVATAALSGINNAGDNNWIVYANENGGCGVCHKSEIGDDIQLFDFYNFWVDLDSTDETVDWLISDGLDFNEIAGQSWLSDEEIELDFI